MSMHRTNYPGARMMDPDHGVNYGKSFSGVYESASSEKEYNLTLRVDVDKARPYTKALNVISGSLARKDAKKSLKLTGKSASAFFRSDKGSLVVTESSVRANLFVVLSNGGKREGQVKITFKQQRNSMKSNVTITIDGNSKHFEDASRSSQFFREVKIDIDYVDKLIWPEIELKNYKSTPALMKERTLSLSNAFEDAGLKINYKRMDSQKVADPTPETRWSKADMFAVMEDYFDHGNGNDENIWCLMASQPPDRRYMGYSFDKDGYAGFGLFTGHTSFNGIDSDEANVRENAMRRFLHYMVHECGHCLGLSHPFELGNPNALSWMNYAWKYDATNGPGRFYDKFRYSFGDDELFILRHQPDKGFKDSYARETGSPFVFSSKPKSDAPDLTPAGEDEEADLDGKTTVGADHALEFSVQFPALPFHKGGVVEFKASLRNIGTLPCKIEPDLTLGGGNLTVFVTDPTGAVQIAKPFVTGIDAPTRRYVILGKHGSSEHSDVYSDVVPLIRGSRGAIFNKVGTYAVKAVYEAGSLKVTSRPATVKIIDEDVDDDVTNDQMRVSASLGGAVSGKTPKVVDYWKSLMAKPVEEKASRLQDILVLIQGLNREVLKVTNGKSSYGTRSKVKKLERTKALISGEQLIKDTSDLVKFCRKKNDVENQHYRKLVLERAVILFKIHESATAEAEYNQMLCDFISRNADFDYIKQINKEWQKIATQDAERKKEADEKDSTFQERVERLIFWTPSDVAVGKEDKSGIGLGVPFNNFDEDQRRRSAVFSEDLEKIEEDTDDLDAVLDYAEGVLCGQEVNQQVYRWAIEKYIVHSKLCKKNNVRYPDPPKRNPAMTADAAITQTKREGQPQEVWMNYWRCDGDFNFHHRHWHAVYQSRNFFEAKRQGELFGYMHSQLLARYDAERESWGLPVVKPYKYDEIESDGFNAGWEFHEDPANYRCAPRPPKQVWNLHQQQALRRHEEDIISCFDKGVLPPRDFGELPMDANLAGHIIESSTWEYSPEFGSLHNFGHMAFCQTKGIPRGGTSYMGSTLTAVRDPIFFRWHKRVDNIYHNWNDRVMEEVGSDAPGVIIEPSDALILPGRDVPKGFDEWQGSNWVNKQFKCEKINTYMKEPTLAFEWDNKLDHEPFSFHIRLRRKPGITGELPLTLRVFICQERCINERKKWIEMDKFVYRLKEDEDHAIIQRRDLESSVIKKLSKDDETSEEKKFATTVDGNCECGWPYRMMLPRGVYGGEKWVLGVIATDNTIDGITRRTGCGSMSYCGTRDQIYPDKRTMGYPFVSNMCIDGNVVSISDAAEKLSNFAISKFQINSDVQVHKPVLDPLVPSPEVKEVPVSQVIWAPYSIAGETGLGEYSRSHVVGRWRVLLNDYDFRKMGAERVCLHFKGRIDSSYTVYDVKIALRHENTLDVDENCNMDVFFNSLKEAEVPKDGLVSDEVVLPVKTSQENDYFVTFTVKSPGCYVYVAQTNVTNSYYVQPGNAEQATIEDNWEKSKHLIKKKFRSLYCIECLQGY